MPTLVATSQDATVATVQAAPANLSAVQEVKLGAGESTIIPAGFVALFVALMASPPESVKLFAKRSAGVSTDTLTADRFADNANGHLWAASYRDALKTACAASMPDLLPYLAIRTEPISGGFALKCYRRAEAPKPHRSRKTHRAEFRAFLSQSVS